MLLNAREVQLLNFWPEKLRILKLATLLFMCTYYLHSKHLFCRTSTQNKLSITIRETRIMLRLKLYFSKVNKHGMTNMINFQKRKTINIYKL